MWAHIEDGRVIELTDIDPAGRYHESWIWEACSASVDLGWSFLNGVFLPPSAPSVEALATGERFWRDGELANNEWLVARHRDELEDGLESTLTAAQYTELQAYRRALRNWPEAGGFPLAEHRPVAPSWLAEQTQ